VFSIVYNRSPKIDMTGSSSLDEKRKRARPTLRKLGSKQSSLCTYPSWSHAKRTLCLFEQTSHISIHMLTQTFESSNYVTSYRLARKSPSSVVQRSIIIAIFLENERTSCPLARKKHNSRSPRRLFATGIFKKNTMDSNQTRQWTQLNKDNTHPVKFTYTKLHHN
jgi:hypothetical protein